MTISGAPVTKKNHSRIVRNRRTGQLLVIPSEAYERWAAHAELQVRASWRRPPLGVPCALEATFYRARLVGDLGNYLAGLCDLLERAGAVQNDRLIVSFDGCRLGHDKERPRIEWELRAIGIGR